MLHTLKRGGSFFALILGALIITSCSASQSTFFTTSNHILPDTVSSKRFDTGKMWTFEDAPLDYFEEEYSFRPDQQWLDHVRLSSLKFAYWCTASFVSADGLVMTNHHCIDFISNKIQRDGENIYRDGFYATTLEEERKIPGITVSQLVLIEDVTEEIVTAINSGKTDEERIANKENKVKEIQDRYKEKTGNKCRVTSLYNGGKYSLYGYKVYDDIRAVYFNESSIGLYGGDPDNFTYPRYNADFAFVRVYEDGKPLQTDNFLKWSKTGAQPNEPIFVIGNPGKTFRLKTMAQLRYYRDLTMRNKSFTTNGQVAYLNKLIDSHPERAEEFKEQMVFVANGAKVYRENVKFLNDPYWMGRKADFEEKFRSAIAAKPELQERFGHLWDGIEAGIDELLSHGNEVAAYSVDEESSLYFLRANNLIEIANQMALPEENRSEKYKDEELNKRIAELAKDEFDFAVDDEDLALHLEFIALNLGKDNSLFNELTNGKTGIEAVNYLKENTVVTDAEKLKELVSKGSDAIYNCGDPIVAYLLQTRSDLKKYLSEQKEAEQTIEALEDQMGQAIYAVYGTTIPPDATFTLRLSDGMMKSYEYNGTKAPLFTTFYGLYDRFYSHEKQYPWDLPERWQNPGKDFDMSTPYNFITTNDIVGGSSGSPVINKEGEVVGLAFDGNLESIPGNFIYSENKNRMVAVSSQGIVELLGDLLGAKRISEELKAGKIPESFKNPVADIDESTSPTEENSK